MKEKQTVFPHRRFGFAEAAAPIPGIEFTQRILQATIASRLDDDKVADALNPSAPATLGMRENQTVFPHRRFGFAEAAAPIPGIGFTERILQAAIGSRLDDDKVADGLNPSAPATSPAWDLG